jgi:hypothetical protein
MIYCTFTLLTLFGLASRNNKIGIWNWNEFGHCQQQIKRFNSYFLNHFFCWKALFNDARSGPPKISLRSETCQNGIHLFIN